jgi:hypothetical protein
MLSARVNSSDQKQRPLASLGSGSMLFHALPCCSMLFHIRQPCAGLWESQGIRVWPRKGGPPVASSMVRFVTFRPSSEVRFLHRKCWRCWLPCILAAACLSGICSTFGLRCIITMRNTSLHEPSNLRHSLRCPKQAHKTRHYFIDPQE